MRIENALVIDGIEYYDIPKFENVYKISKCGKIISKSKFKDFRLLKQHLDKYGYYKVVLYSLDNKPLTSQIHILVAIVFLNHIPDGHKLVVDHKDRNKQNNNLTNLRLITHRENLSNNNRKSNHVGVVFCKTHNKYLSRISINKKRIYLGYFNEELDAINAYKKALNIHISNNGV